jgi:hypothetical protein
VCVCVIEISNDLPYTDYTEYFAPDFQLHPPVTNPVVNLNSRAYVESLRQTAFEQIRALAGAPSVQMHQVPTPIILDSDDDDWDDHDPDVRETQRFRDMNVVHESEFYEDDFDNDHDEICDI